jgi:hypothetical protein
MIRLIVAAIPAGYYLVAVASLMLTVRWVSEASAGSVQDCSLVMLNRLGERARLRLRDGREVWLDSSDVRSLFCPPIGTEISKPRWSMEYRLDGQTQPWRNRPGFAGMTAGGGSTFGRCSGVVEEQEALPMT